MIDTTLTSPNLLDVSQATIIKTTTPTTIVESSTINSMPITNNANMTTTTTTIPITHTSSTSTFTTNNSKESINNPNTNALTTNTNASSTLTVTPVAFAAISNNTPSSIMSSSELIQLPLNDSLDDQILQLTNLNHHASNYNTHLQTQQNSNRQQSSSSSIPNMLSLSTTQQTTTPILPTNLYSRNTQQQSQLHGHHQPHPPTTQK